MSAGEHDSLGDIEHECWPAIDRRRFLAVTGTTAAAGLILAACTSSGSGGSGKGTGTPGTGGSGSPGAAPRVPAYIKVAALGASVELVAVNTYRAGIRLAERGALGKVPPALATFVSAAETHHKEHAASWNSLLSAAGYATVVSPDPVLRRVVRAELAKLRHVESLARLALTLEALAAATCLRSLTTISNKQAIATAASIQPVEMQHAAVIRFLLGVDPVPSAFASSSGARPRTDYPIASKATS
jgi:hypothetical protein